MKPQCSTCKYFHNDPLEGGLCLHGGFNKTLDGRVHSDWPDAPLGDAWYNYCKGNWYKPKWWAGTFDFAMANVGKTTAIIVFVFLAYYFVRSHY